MKFQVYVEIGLVLLRYSSAMFHVKHCLVQENETRTMTARLRAFPAIFWRVEHAQDFDGVVADAVRNDVRGAGYYQLAGAGDAAEAAQGWMGGEQVDAGRDALHYSRSGLRIVACDVARPLRRDF